MGFVGSLAGYAGGMISNCTVTELPLQTAMYPVGSTILLMLEISGVLSGNCVRTQKLLIAARK